MIKRELYSKFLELIGEFRHELGYKLARFYVGKDMINEIKTFEIFFDNDDFALELYGTPNSTTINKPYTKKVTDEEYKHLKKINDFIVKELNVFEGEIYE